MSYSKKTLLSISLLAVSVSTFAGTPNSIVTVPQSIPAISQAGLIAMAFIIGIIGARLIHKFRVSKT